MVISGFDLDDGNWPKCGKHGLSRAEIEFALSVEPTFYLDRAFGANEQRYRCISRNQDGRYVFIAFTIRLAEGRLLVRPISARYMHQREIDNYGK
ncbi:MAG: BrnT family toxin [Pseudomonadota bacterium]